VDESGDPVTVASVVYQGPAGEDGSIADAWEGTWDDGTAYASGRIVKHDDGKVYLALRDTEAGEEPGVVAEAWDVLFQPEDLLGVGVGGVLSGSLPNPGFAVNMVEQDELDAIQGAPSGLATLDEGGLLVQHAKEVASITAAKALTGLPNGAVLSVGGTQGGTFTVDTSSTDEDGVLTFALDDEGGRLVRAWDGRTLCAAWAGLSPGSTPAENAAASAALTAALAALASAESPVTVTFAAGTTEIAPYNPGGGIYASLDLSGLSGVTLDLTGATLAMANPHPIGTSANWHLLLMAETTDVVIRGGTLDGNGLVQTTDVSEQAHLIDVRPGSKRIRIEGVTFNDGPNDGLRLFGEAGSEVEHVSIVGCHFYANGRSGITVQRGTRYVTLLANVFRGTSDQDIDFEPSGTGEVGPYAIVGNTMDRTGSGGGAEAVTLSGVSSSSPSKNVTFSGNTLIGGILQAVHITDSAITGNTFVGKSGRSSPAIYLRRRVEDVVVADNSIYNADGAGIGVDAASGAVPQRLSITGNTVEVGSAAVQGIFVEGGNHVVIAHNVVRGAGGSLGISVRNTLSGTTGYGHSVSNNVVLNFLRGVSVNATPGNLVGVSVQGNVFDDDQETPTQATGVLLTGGASSALTGLTVAGNRAVRGLTTMVSGLGGTGVPSFYAVGGNAGGVGQYVGSGSPESVVTAPVGSSYYDVTNGVAYEKRSGTGNTGWLTSGSGLAGSATWDPPSLASGAQQTTTVTVTGAALGDYVECSFSLDLAGTTLRAYVSAANTVTVVHRNDTGGAVDLGSGTLRVRVRKP